ncbi:hypothetical protein AVEN_199782-1, partial [Araneus ventricosus]
MRKPLTLRYIPSSGMEQFTSLTNDSLLSEEARMCKKSGTTSHPRALGAPPT